MHHSSHPVPVATAAPLLRAVLILVLMSAAASAVLVVSSAPIGWLVLGIAVVAGPVAVAVEGRSRRRAERPAAQERTPLDVRESHWEAA